MHRGIRPWLLLGIACTGGQGPSGPRPGSRVVLEFGAAWGIAWPPPWCPVSDGRQTCLRFLPDSSEVVLYRDGWDRPYSVVRTWNGVSPIRAVDLRDSLRQALERRGARRLSDEAGPADPEYRMHHIHMRWCLDSAIVSVGRSWQEERRPETVHLLVGAIPTRECSGQEGR
jgi:hypothetical protein